jgi:sulfofructosephosphate aldolase
VPASARLAALRRPSGGFAIVAMDQRESLRAMATEATGHRADDQALVSFKVAVARTLSPSASAMLLDIDYGVAPVLESRALVGGCALIVAADRLQQRPGGPVTETDIDERVDPGAVRALGAVALKLLVIWRDDARRERRREMVERFVDLCADADLASVVEGIVRGPEGFDREAAIVEAARELGARCDLYKAEVPLFGRASLDAIAARSRAITAVLPCPWVVLSQGVEIDDYPGAVAAACAGGASGFLAGRAIWRDVVGATPLEAQLRARALPRLVRLDAIVEDAMRMRAAAAARSH